MNIGNQEGTSR